MKKIFCTVFIAIFTAVTLGYPAISCAGTAQIFFNTVPEGATLYLNGIKMGKTPLMVPVQGKYWYELTGSKRPQVRVEKVGYHPYYETMNPSEIDFVMLVGGLICCIPFLWAFELPSQYNIVLIPVHSE